MNSFFIWLEATAPSVWIRESTSVFVFPTILTAHAIGMALAVGVNAAMALRLAGVAPGVPMEEMKRFVPVMWIGFWMNTVSGVLLLIGYPTKALTNPVFYLKIALIAVGMWLFKRMAAWMWREPEGEAGGMGAPAATLSRGQGDPRRSVSVSSPRGWGPAAGGSMLTRRDTSGRRLGFASLGCWAAAITAGRLLAYTATRILATW